MRRPSYLPFPSTPCGDRSGLQPPKRPTTPSADFCPAVRAPCGSLSPPVTPEDTRQISWGKPRSLPRTPAGFTVQALDGYGLRDFLPARPTRAASYPVAVRQVAISFHASFRRSLAVPPLRFTRASPPSGCTGDFHPQTAGHAQHTGRCAPLARWPAAILDRGCARALGRSGWGEETALVTRTKKHRKRCGDDGAGFELTIGAAADPAAKRLGW